MFPGSSAAAAQTRFGRKFSILEFGSFSLLLLLLLLTAVGAVDPF